MPDWVQTAYADYAKRLPNEARLVLVELPVAHRGKNPDIDRLKAAEAEGGGARRDSRTHTRAAQRGRCSRGL